MTAKESRIADISVLKQNDTHAQHTIESFLARPVLVSAFDWNITQGQTTQVLGLNLDSMLTASAVWQQKLSGYGLLKATIILRVQINASPMNAGALLFTHKPGRSTTPYTYKTRRSLASLSQLPSVVMDAQQREMEFEIPYVAPVRYYTLGAIPPVYAWGDVDAYVYSPLTNGTGGTTEVLASIWMHLKDVELANPIVGQMGRGTFKATKKSPTEQEVRPVSTVLSAVSTMATSLSAIPLLSSVTGPVAWFTNIAAGVASSFGWSKPALQTTGERVIVGSHFGSQNVHCVDNSQQLAPSIDNSIRIMDDLGRYDVDEMSINFIKTRWVYIDQFDWATTQGLGERLWLTVLSPFALPRNITNATVGDYSFTQSSLTPVGLLGRLFKKYRGGFCLRFRILKTPMHTGRLAVSFLPTKDTTTAGPSFDQTDFLLKHMVDVTEGNEICLAFPYMHPESFIDSDVPIGKVYVDVINALRCPEVVSNTINVVVEARALDDMEFQEPTQVALQPIVAQMGVNLEGETEQIVESSIGNSQTKTMSGLSQYTTGEQLGSLLQLLKRYYRLQGLRMSAFLNVAPRIRKSFNPFMTSPYTVRAGNFDQIEIGGDYLTLFSSMYLFARGGLRIRFFSDGDNRNVATWIDVPAKTSIASTSTVPNWDPSLSVELNMANNAGISPCVNNTFYGGFSVQCPAYCDNYARYTEVRPSSFVTPPPYSLTYESIGKLSDAPEDQYRLHLYRSCADDFQLAYWLGVPDLAENVVYTP